VLDFGSAFYRLFKPKGCFLCDLRLGNEFNEIEASFEVLFLHEMNNPTLYPTLRNLKKIEVVVKWFIKP